ncbi:helix-turn-helix domain-containing protein [Paenibacillus agricola]|uniref:Helix-turn-helix transcriptional regulator n=1 Tax=Paenibacillus agricola TaxID=2716264 RepID=A0ABX0J344_9BACL|nr:helix-turn-helix domain-containing protein [Paenibacillus agricola]NHN29539.1 helix-turn-helix transcriptional regulator [Paenibacillus agricola]
MRRGLEYIRRTFFSLLPRTNYLKRLIWFGCLTVSIPIILAGSAYYHFSITKLADQFSEDNKISLTVAKDRMENVLANIEMGSLNVSNHTLMKENIGRPGFKTDFLQHMLIQDILQTYKNSNNLIDDLIFYEKLSDVMVSHNYGYVVFGTSMNRKDVETALNLKVPAAWVYLTDSAANGYISYIRRLPVMPSEQAQGVLLVQVKEEVLRRNLVTFSTYSKNQSILILDSNNKIILNSSGNANWGPLAGDTTGLSAILSSEESTGQFEIKAANGDTYMAVFQRSLLGRTYISLLPEKDLLQQVSWIGWLTVFSVAVFLLVSLLLTFFASKMMYNPIENLIKYGENLQGGRSIKQQGNEIEFLKSCLGHLNQQALALETYMQKTQPNLRDQLLKKLLKGFAGSGESLRNECAEYELPMTGSFIVLITIVENLFKEKRFLPNEGAIVLFAIMNVIKELLAKSALDGYVIENNERESITILHFTEQVPREQILELTRSFAEEIKDALKKYLSFSVSNGIGGIYKEIKRLPDCYREAEAALQYRMLNDTQATLLFDELEPSEKQSLFFYPREQEKVIVDALSRGELLYAEKGLNQFAKTLRDSGSYNTIYQCYHVLLSSIIQSLEEQGPGVIDSLEGNWFDQLKARQTAREIYEWYIEIIFPLYQQITEDFRKQSVKIAIQKVCKHIRENPGASHSLIESADMIGMSPSYLSRMFKKEVGVAFIEYLTEYKVEKAKQSLQDTDLSVMEIAEVVGYSERNLNRAFQRYVGMSPKQYRLSNR